MKTERITIRIAETEKEKVQELVKLEEKQTMSDLIWFLLKKRYEKKTGKDFR